MVVAQHRVLPARLSGLAPALGIGGFFAGYFGFMFAGGPWFMRALPLIIALIAGLVGARERAFHARTGYRWLVLHGPSVWVGIELIRGVIPVLGTWGFAAYALYAQPWLIQPVSLLGVYGLSLLILLVNYALAQAQPPLDQKNALRYPSFKRAKRSQAVRNKILPHSSLLTVILLVCCSLFPLLTAYRYPPFLNDDAYITLTYAKNLARGNGFVLNHPPAVLGTTTPLFTLTVAGLALLLPQVSLPVLAVFLSAFCWLGILWVFFFFRKEWGLANWQVCLLALVVTGSGWIDFLGMEAYPFAFLLVLSISLLLRGHCWLTGWIAGLLFLTRGEGVLVLVILAIALLVRQWKAKAEGSKFVSSLLQLLVGFALPVSLWVVYAQRTFGSFLPNTLATKQAQGQNPLWRPFVQQLIMDWVPQWGKSFAYATWPWFNLWWLTVLIGLLDVLLRKRQWFILVGWIVLYLVGYTVLNVPGYLWYQLPILFVLNLLFGLGMIQVVEMLTMYLKPHRLALALSILFIAAFVFLLAKPTVHAMRSYKGDPRGPSYTALSQWFRDHTKPSESIAFIEIGYLGYYTENRIIDLAGLVLPNIVPHIAAGDFAWGFWHYKPDYYVYLPDFDRALASIRANPRFDQEYQPVATLPGPRKTDFTIYKRVSN